MKQRILHALMCDLQGGCSEQCPYFNENCSDIADGIPTKEIFDFIVSLLHQNSELRKLLDVEIQNTNKALEIISRYEAFIQANPMNRGEPQ